MPKVSTIEREETLRPVARGRVSTDVEDAGLKKTQAAANKILEDTFERERLRANKLVQNQNEIVRQQFGLAQDGEGGAFTQNGRDAVGIASSTLAGYDLMNDELINNAHNEETRVIAEENGLRFRIKLEGRLNKHEFEQYDVVEAEVYTTGLASTINHASSADVNLIEGLKNVEVSTNEFWIGKGKDKGFRDVKVQEAQSAIIIASMDRLRAEDKDDEALALFNDKRSQKILSTDQKSALKPKLEDGSRLQQAQKKTDEILLEGGSLESQLKKARAIKDGKLRDEVVKRINARNKEKADFRKEREIQIREDTWAEMKRLREEGVSDGVLQVMIDHIANNTTRTAMEKWLHAGPVIKNNNSAWVDFLSKSPTELSKMTAFEVETKYWSKFDDVHRTRSETMWRNASKKEAQTTTIITPSSMAENTWKSLGLGKPSDTPDAFADFEQEFQDQVVYFELTTLGGKRKASREELGDILSRIAMNFIMVDVDLSFLPTGTTRLPIGEVEVGAEIEGVEFERPKKRVSPKRQRAIDRLKKDGKAVTEANIAFVEGKL